MTFEEIEQSSVETESSESTESQSEGSTETKESAPAQVEAKQTDTPFHEHPRFKELVEQKNQALQGQRQLELKLAQLEGRLSQPQTPANQAAKDELIDDLRKIDPRLADRLEAATKTNATVEALQKRLDEFENGTKQQSQQAQVKEAVARINSWHDTNKVAPQIKQAINSQLDVLYMQGKLNPENLETAYKAAYEPYKAFMEELKRETLKSYVPAKKADASTPTSQPKGSPAKPAAKKPTYSNDRETRINQLAQEYVKSQERNKQASSV